MSDDERAWRDKAPKDNRLPSISSNRYYSGSRPNRRSKLYLSFAVLFIIIAVSISLMIIFNYMLAGERDVYYAKIREMQSELKRNDEECRKRGDEIRSAIQEYRDELLKTIGKNRESPNKIIVQPPRIND